MYKIEISEGLSQNKGYPQDESTLKRLYLIDKDE